MWKNLRVSTFEKEGPYRVSKWADVHALLSKDEMRALLSSLGQIAFYPLDCVLTREEDFFARFSNGYSRYIDKLQDNKECADEDFRLLHASFSPAMEAFYRIALPDGRSILKCCRPVVCIKPHRFMFSSFDKSFKSSVFGPDTIPWGVCFSYPGLYQDNQTLRAEKTHCPHKYPATACFARLRRFLRYQTLPTAFQLDGKKVYAPIRFGKECLEWIGRYQKLPQNHLQLADL